MKARTGDFLDSLREFWREFSKVKSGLVGLAILLVFILLAIIGPSIVPFPGATQNWRKMNFWEDNSLASPPVWTNWLPWVKKKAVVSSLLPAPVMNEEIQDNGTVIRTYAFHYGYEYDQAPRDLVLRFDGEGQLAAVISLTRPDGLTADLWQGQMEIAPDSTFRISVANDAEQAVIEFVRAQDPDAASTMSAGLINPLAILFSKLDSSLADNPTALKGAYTVTARTLLLSGDATLDTPTGFISGRVAGIMGTDLAKRDVFTGIIVGIRWALIIGLLTSIITVLVGVVLGVVAAYFGGFVDWLLNRLYEFIYLLPVLPFLIVISAIFKPSIWTLIILICLFFWTGPYKPVYSMALQIREETYVEASRALGARRLWIIFRHIVPILLPYSFAVMALSIPGVIVYEASVSLLGLGDSTIVTWGQILHDALGQGAVINKLWWWVVPPGLMIALMGMSFAFLGTALDKILHPKLKTR
jgi:peptide/nickel transport system permease protein